MGTHLGAMNPSGGVFPSLARPLILVPTGSREKSKDKRQVLSTVVCSVVDRPDMNSKSSCCEGS